jgi:hypothetical protein
MSRTSRQEKAEARLRILEEQFLADLIAALRDCASGTWGMFGRNDHIIAALPEREMLKSKVAERLIEDGEELSCMRLELGFTEPFPPFKRFMEYRQMRGSSTPGEPKLAVEFLTLLGES